MNTLSRIATAVALSLGLAAAAHSHPTSRGDGHGARQGAPHQGMHGGMGHGRMQHGGMHGAEHQAASGHAGHEPQAGAGLMTPGERAAWREKMRNARTPEERRQIAQANRAEMEKRAAEKGVTLPEQHGPNRRGDAPAAGEHRH
jgi:hypothetical protein